MGGVDLADQMVSIVYGLDRKSCKLCKKVFFRLLMRAVINSWIAYCELKHRKTPLLDFIVPLAEALMASGKLNAQYQHRRGTRRPSKTSRSLLNVGDHLPVATKTQRRPISLLKLLLFSGHKAPSIGDSSKHIGLKVLVEA
ncbi:piggyBac transposable element-derived protein 4 [Trichonephila clavata]|uniref:PiggyBac transposable element-derived protein 4 n=1 Tax=Trichonephila clavata TaxID=2740835 RepID=A0A8X6G6N9_TRICU|nr:piggyBac transposable element-derived protein 4 [Trichonephila clavata]